MSVIAAITGFGRLLRLFDSSSDSEMSNAKDSYQRYHDLCLEIAERHGFGVQVGCGVFAALSPNNSYVSNLRDADALMRGFRRGTPKSQVTVHTYHANKDKAWRMCEGVDPLEVFRGPKTRSFYHNILDPQNPEHVTIDGHIFWAWMGRRGRLQSRIKDMGANVTPRLYVEISDSIRLIGELRGVVPCQAQAIIWQVWRRMHNVVGTRQLDLIPSDVLAIQSRNQALYAGGAGR